MEISFFLYVINEEDLNCDITRPLWKNVFEMTGFFSWKLKKNHVHLYKLNVLDRVWFALFQK